MNSILTSNEYTLLLKLKQVSCGFPCPNFGLAKWNRQQNKVIPYEISPQGSCGEYYNTSWTTCLAEDPDDGTLWAGSNDGLIHFFPYNGTFIVYRHRKSRDKLSEVYNHLLFDKQGQQWIGSWGRGIKIFNKKTLQFKEYCWYPAISGSVNICSGIAQMDDTHLWAGALGNDI